MTVPGGHEAWLRSVPTTAQELAKQWSLTVDEPFHTVGEASWVAPAIDASGNELVLKIGRWHTEAVHEADGLRLWDGRGAVRLHDSAEEDETVALLLERCVPGTPLSDRPEDEQDEILTGLLRTLWIELAPDHPFRPLQVMCDQWADEFEQKMATGTMPVDPGLVGDGIALLRALPATAQRNVLLCTDLHAGNVLAAEREPWLAIDPKPYVGDPAYDVVQHLLNCEERLLDDPHGLVERVASLADLDPGRVLLWLFARCVQESLEQPSLAAVACRIAPD